VTGTISSVSADRRHRFSKVPVESIRLVEGFGVEGDAHFGATVQHRSRARYRPGEPNLRQVHLVQEELLDELVGRGFRVAAGVIGENITTRGVDLSALPTGTRLRLGGDAVVELTGLRNPCVQLDRYQDGLMAAVLDRGSNGQVIRRAGVMGVVLTGGVVRPGDDVEVALPAGPTPALGPV
jgi:MOSC domain-containing protein YiiM